LAALGGRPTVGHSRHPAPAGGQHHRNSRPREGAVAETARVHTSLRQVSILTDRTATIRASVRDVQFTLLLTGGPGCHGHVCLLAKVLGTVIPSVALPLAVIGTFGVMKLVGFSLDNLSLMALTISTGFVVDERYCDDREYRPPSLKLGTRRGSALKGAEANRVHRDLAERVVDLVFIPLLFMTGIVGRLFREFAITLSVASGLRRRLAHAHADDVRPAAKVREGSTARTVLRHPGRMFKKKPCSIWYDRAPMGAPTFSR